LPLAAFAEAPAAGDFSNYEDQQKFKLNQWLFVLIRGSWRAVLRFGYCGFVWEL
jgi:hypothetical protein